MDKSKYDMDTIFIANAENITLQYGKPHHVVVVIVLTLWPLVMYTRITFIIMLNIEIHERFVITLCLYLN